MSKQTNWYVYILQCADGTYYTGITTDLDRRLREHNQASCGAKYTRARRPVVLAYSETALNRSIASKREAQIKRLTHQQKSMLSGSAK